MLQFYDKAAKCLLTRDQLLDNHYMVHRDDNKCEFMLKHSELQHPGYRPSHANHRCLRCKQPFSMTVHDGPQPCKYHPKSCMFYGATKKSKYPCCNERKESPGCKDGVHIHCSNLSRGTLYTQGPAKQSYHPIPAVSTTKYGDYHAQGQMWPVSEAPSESKESDGKKKVLAMDCERVYTTGRF